MTDRADPPEYLAVGNAAALAGIPERTLRYWIASGKLPATSGGRGKLVRLDDVQRVAALAGRPAATAATAAAANGIAAEFADEVAATPAVPDQARQQLEAIRDEWLLPLVEQIRHLERDHGRLEAERDAERRRAEVAEERAETLQARLEALQASQAAQEAHSGPLRPLRVSQATGADSRDTGATPAPWWAVWRRWQ